MCNRSNTAAASYDISCTAAAPHGHFPNQDNYSAVTRSLCHRCIFGFLPRYLALVCKVLGHNEASRTTVGLRSSQHIVTPPRPARCNILVTDTSQLLHAEGKANSRVVVQTLLHNKPPQMLVCTKDERAPECIAGRRTHVTLAAHGESGPAGETCGGGAAARHRPGGHGGHPGAHGRTAGSRGR